MSTRNLKDFLTTEKDQERKFTKIPLPEFRMWELDLDKEERKLDSAKEGKDEKDKLDFDDLEDDFVDDFVIIDRRQEKKGPSYQKMKIVEEEKIKDSGSGS